MKILAIETSCDETACAIVEDGVKILSSVVASSSTMHAKYGGIVPEVAAREQLACIMPTIHEAITSLEENSKKEISDETLLQSIHSHIDAIAITVGPGLIGSLLVGVETAKTLSFATQKPIIPVNHVLAHMYANFLSSSEENSSRDPSRDNIRIIEFPAISLVVSGGHTELFLMKNEKDLIWLGGTLDDAAGEAFDKTARLLGFENRGGPAIQEAALKNSVSHNNGQKIPKLPRPMMYDDTLNFSFSGLKTAILREWKKENTHDENFIHGLAYEVQEAITDVLVSKTMHAANLHNAKSILISGGVAANLRLREKLANSVQKLDVKTQLHIPPTRLCTDNAAYIASYAYFRGIQTNWQKITAIPDLTVENI